MLKIWPQNQTKVKCGEIFSHSYADYTIYCTFCDMKSFKFEDFLLHIQNVHFVNNLLGTETIITDCHHLFEVCVKNEDKMKNEKKVLYDDLEQPYDEYYDTNNYNLNGKNSNKEPIAILRKTEREIIHTKRKTCKLKSFSENEEEKNSPCSDKDFKPLLNKQKYPAGENEKPKVITKKKQFNEHPCPECGKIFLLLKLLDLHVYEFHSGYKCSMCDKRFRRRAHLVGHEKTHTAEKKFTCPVKECSKGFTEEEYLKRHLEVHTMDCTFICDFENCGKSFQTKRRLAIHNYTHRKPKKFVCDACGYSCRANVTLLIHQRVHTGEKPFGCEVCQKSFASKTALTAHMHSHSNVRPHVCKICNASFTNPRALQKHILIHSNERGYKCKLCDSTFKQSTGLNGHMRRLHRVPKFSLVAVPLERSLF